MRTQTTSHEAAKVGTERLNVVIHKAEDATTSQSSEFDDEELSRLTKEDVLEIRNLLKTKTN